MVAARTRPGDAMAHLVALGLRHRDLRREDLLRRLLRAVEARNRAVFDGDRAAWYQANLRVQSLQQQMEETPWPAASS